MSTPSSRSFVARLSVAAVVAGSAVGAVGLAPSTAAEVPSTTVTPDPSYQQPAFEGWGTSLVWFANATGDYPDEIRDRLADLVFGEDGLRLNIARYNIGGGNAPDVPDYLRAGGAVEGWWNAPAGTTRDDVDWWSADDPDDWNPDADATQRWWVDRIKDDITHWETFSNSPPWFMTESGYVSGNFDSSANNLKESSVEDFARYVVGATERLEDAEGISVDTVDPFNEPNTPYWGTQLGADGDPVGGRQEGAHIGPELQAKVLRAIDPVLEDSTTDAVVSAMDETNPPTFVTNWLSYPQEAKDVVEQMNVHTYGTSRRTAVRDLAKSEDKPLWMSEVGGNWGDRQDFESMLPGLGIAQHMTDDLRELEPEAWVFWQPVEDYTNMAPGGETENGMNWGSIQLRFDCTDEDTLQTCPIYTNTKFDTIRNFTHYIHPGDRIVRSDDRNTIAAVDAGERTATLVHTNSAGSAKDVTVDLSKFGTVGPKATVTPVVTDVDGALQEGTPVPVDGTTATVRVPAQSVTTLVVSDVRGVADDAATFRADHTYRLAGVQSGKSLAAEGDGLVIRSTDPASAAQLFTVTPLDGEPSNRTEYQVRSLDGRQVAVRDGSPVLEEAPLARAGSTRGVAEAARWVLSTTGDGTWVLTSAVTPANLEVGGQSTQDGAGVSLWQPNAGANQRWTVTDETVTGVTDVEVLTVPGVAPDLPSTVVPDRPGGGSGAVPVEWVDAPAARFKEVGQKFAFGTATDPATGAALRVRAVVTTDTVSSTEPATATVPLGGTPDLPTEVTAVSDRYAVETTLPVVWDTGGVAFDTLGDVTVTGTAELPDGTTLPATVVVTVTPAPDVNVALEQGTEASATYTEPGYSAAGVVNGDLGDKAWSNWVGGAQRPGDTLTVTLPEAHDVTTVTTRFHQDGSNVSYARRLMVQARVDGSWTPVSGWVDVVPEFADGLPGAPVVEVPVADGEGMPVTTDAVRVVMEADSFMTVSEVEVFATAG